jgi:20S proteasome subunit beta 2
VLGGVDETGPHLFTVQPHGSTTELPYVTMGSGSLAAMAVFESIWRADMEVRNPLETAWSLLTCLAEQRATAIALVVDAISAGIFNDLGSGSNVDVCVITKDRTEMLRNFEKPNERVKKEKSYVFRRGTTACKKEDVRSLIVGEASTVVGGNAMDTT